MRTHRDGIAGKADGRWPQVLRRGKPTFLVELAVVGQISLRHDAQQLSFLDDGCTVEQQIAHYDGQSDDGDDVELTGKVKQRQYTSFGSIEEKALAEQVLAGVACDGEFREDDYFDALALGLCDDGLYLLKIVGGIGHLYGRHSRSYFDESVLHIETKWGFYGVT